MEDRITISDKLDAMERQTKAAMAMPQAELEFRAAAAHKVCEVTAEKYADARAVVASLKKQLHEAVRFNEFDRIESLTNGLRVHAAAENAAYGDLVRSLDEFNLHDIQLQCRAEKARREAA